MSTARSATLSSAASSTRSFGAFFAATKEQPVYVILGVQGSGTNLLRSILVRAFNFAFVKDQSIVFSAAARVGTTASPDAVRRQFEFIRSRLFPSPLTRKTGRRIKSNASYDGIDDHFDPASIGSAAELAHFVYAYAAFSRGTSLMAIKSDDLWEHIGEIDTVLPNRRIVLLTRDFRDNLLSITTKNFGPIDPLVAARYVKERFAYYEAEFHRTAPEHRLHVRYEDLLAAPDTFVARFREHFGVSPQGQAPAPVDRSRIRHNNVRKWSRLSPRQLAYCEAILRQELQTYGYGLECDPVEMPGPATWWNARLRDAVQRVPQKLGLVLRRLRN